MEDNPYKTTETWDDQSRPNKGNRKTRVFKKILIGLGVVMLLIIILFVWAGIKATVTYNKLEGKAEPLIKNVLAEQSPWNYETLKPNLSKLWLDNISEEESRKLIKLFSKMGNFESITELNWNGCSTNTATEIGTIDRCDYLATVKYENGDALVTVGIVDEEDSPKIIQLHINSDVFFE